MSTDPKKSPDPDEEIPMPDIYSEEFAVDESLVEDTELDNAGRDNDSGFNPYDTAILYKK